MSKVSRGGGSAYSGSGSSIGGSRPAWRRWMAWKGSGRVFLVLLVTLSLWAFFPVLAPLPALSSSSSDPAAAAASARRHSSKVVTHAFRISDDTFWKDDQPFQIIGGDLHYFRVLPEGDRCGGDVLGQGRWRRGPPAKYWKDRLLRAKALGLNTIQTYVPWNIHEPQPGRWVFAGIADIESFLKLAQELGFLVMLRVGPYICAEWDLGGFPAWLLAVEPALRLRSSDHAYLLLVKKWWDVLLPKLVPLLYKNGGPIIMVQIENEFGSYGYDHSYLHQLVALAREHLGDQVILYTTDGGSWDLLRRGTIPGEDVFAAVDFSTGESPWPIFNLQKKFNAPGKSPPLSAEFYTGWLTHWGEKNAETSAEFTAMELEKILSQNASVVLYMAHGGTNFGFYNGANTGQNDSDYKPDLTSYDYDAPIKEDGDVENLKFRAIRSVIEKYSRVSLPPLPRNTGRSRYGKLKVSKVASFFEILDALCDPVDMVKKKTPLAMELVGQMFGFVLYVSEYPTKHTESVLSIPKVHDRAQVFVSCALDESQVNPRFLGTIERWSSRELRIPKIDCPSNIRLFILVENLGRVNYGQYLYDRKGILSDVILDGDVLWGWKMVPISFHNLSKLLQFNPIVQVADSRMDGTSANSNLKRNSRLISNRPEFYEGRFTIARKDQVKDTFISLNGWNKGIVFVNDFNIGRYWPSVGPQCTLYVPAPILRMGENVVMIFELHAPSHDLVVKFVDKPDFSCGSKSRRS
ncbi:hypothetical protein Taro_033237 [Colocasia esculenta]|uniref:Beta-galactosidase n=1 Tax=Colocasia esculenta TaxID=4460 RepID=A0A843VTC8_COLES|nr:hypothetical protein [Colocasia esculenta]